ncbi:MAG: DUF4011 domain-containing protein [Burkholderiales bacterium]|nr:DUF4011 domain-containing protein [Burkholderiales bacterium]
MPDIAPLTALVAAGVASGGLQTDDVLAIALPLLREAAALHERGLVAELADVHAYRVVESDGGAQRLELARPEGVAPRSEAGAIARVQAPAASVLRVVGESRITQEEGLGLQVDDLSVVESADAASLSRPVYLPGYVSWERVLGHHDPVADILGLGQVLAALACGLDLCELDDLRAFARHRQNLFELNERLHPVLAAVIGEMTELDRHRRARDLPSLIRRLETWRDQPRELSLEQTLARGSTPADGAAARRRAVHVHLRDRLFDLSRRNRLLHFRPTQATVNMTVASVPLVVDLKNIRADQLCVWGGRFAEEVLSGTRVSLASWLRFEDQPWLPASLDRVIQDARRDRAEYGLSQLSLVLAFLRWHNLKETREERVSSPLLLLPVDLARRKGVRDQYTLQADTTEAEVNPVLRQQLRQVYGIELPETVDLLDDGVARFHARLQAMIAATEPGVQLKLVDTPEIELIHQRAKQRLEQFRRRRRAAPVRQAAAASLDFSYAEDDFRPLGLRLFEERVTPARLPVGLIAGAPPAPRRQQMVASADEAERRSFALRDAATTGNPFEWHVDLSSVTLGNFNYRKMSLVRDYNALIEEDRASPAVERIFSPQPRAFDLTPPAPLALADRWAVVPADATQTASVALAREGVSYIIQGPPGTGKSQTITNLIADALGRGKRVLFVCEKRAAIDVVFHRLRQQGLDELCCMIHDSQADKKSFVLNLKQTYEHWLAGEDGLPDLQRQRQALIDGLGQHVQALERFDAAMRDVPEALGMTVRALFDRLVTLASHAPQADALTVRQREALPTPAAWQAHASLAKRLGETLAEVGGGQVFARHPFAQLSDAVVRDDRPVSRLADACDAAEALVDRCETLADTFAPGTAPSWRDLVLRVGQARRLQALARQGLLGLLDAQAAVVAEFDAAIADVAARQQAFDAAATHTGAWRDRFAPADAQAALALAQARENAFSRWFSGDWWRLSGELKRRYDFAKHPVRPAFSSVLAALVAEQKASLDLDAARARFAARFGDGDPVQRAAALAALRAEGSTEPGIAAFHRELLQAGEAAAARVARLVQAGPDVDALDAALDTLLRDAAALPFAGLGETVRDLREQSDVLPDLLPLLAELAVADPAVAAALRTLPLLPDAIDWAVAREGLERLYRVERWLPRFDGAVLAGHVRSLAAAEKKLLALNAHVVRAGVHHRFLRNVQRSTLAASQLDADGKAFKKAYAAGRRELEHEFGKSMRYKAIRELASGEPGRVVRDMKPVWLMSPLSVSDTLPLANDLFDLVVFDEASQIPVEEAVPALYRAPQTIIVGDEMQLPPTSFFASSRDAEDDTVAVDEDGERVAIVLDADSLLNQGARNLPATLLAWHYRSRHESLIGFSNAAFYAGQLFTIPDRAVPVGPRAPIVADAGEGGSMDVAANVDALLARAISFHVVERSPYADRRNEGEARTIARLVRELLRRETGLSIGIAAFSEAQQAAIEEALAELGEDDADFAARLEAESTREQDDQFCGLFVKNLENVQGDERDVILLSVCYGPNAQGRMAMNFGPINQRGGEKRLNVIFSRARQHMAVVSSIRHGAITNDYNEGAAALKSFLRYAEQVSLGDAVLAQRVLEGLNPLARQALGGVNDVEAVAAQLADALRRRGHAVDERIGQSRFRCDLGIRDPARGDHYALGVMIDTAEHYANRDVLERYVSRPRILGAFGWRTLQVLARDWHHDRDAVLEAIERALRDPEIEEPAAEPEGDADPAPPVATTAATPAQVRVTAESTSLEGSSAPPPPPPPAETTSLPWRRLEFVEGTSRKFWQIRREGSDVLIAFGRIGTSGQSQRKPFANGAGAQAEIDKLVAEKLRKGYHEA